MIAPMKKGPYGFFFKTEKTRHKDMTLCKEKKSSDGEKQRGCFYEHVF